jgi:hypothetical protein
MHSSPISIPRLDGALLKHISSQRNPRSRTGIVTYGDESRRIHFKQYDDEIALLREAQALQQAGAATRDFVNVRPLRVLGCCTDGNLLLTEYAESYESLFNYLWNNSSLLRLRRFSRASPVNIAQRLGAWLRCYHRSSAGAPDNVTSRRKVIVDMCRGKLAHLRERFSSALSDATANKLSRYFEEVSQLSESWQWGSACTIHGDLAPANLMIGPDGDLVVLDFADSRDGLAIEDLVRLWHELWSISQTTPYRRRTLTPAIEALTGAYGDSGLNASDPAFVLCRCLNALSLILAFKMFGRYYGISGYFSASSQSAANTRWLDNLKV